MQACSYRRRPARLTLLLASNTKKKLLEFSPRELIVFGKKICIKQRCKVCDYRLVKKVFTQIILKIFKCINIPFIYLRNTCLLLFWSTYSTWLCFKLWKINILTSIREVSKLIYKYENKILYGRSCLPYFMCYSHRMNLTSLKL